MTYDFGGTKRPKSKKMKKMKKKNKNDKQACKLHIVFLIRFECEVCVKAIATSKV